MRESVSGRARYCLCLKQGGNNAIVVLCFSFSRARGYKSFLCSTQLSKKFILIINVKTPTIVGILTFISMINTSPERLKARNFLIRWYFGFCEQLKFRAQLS